MKRLEVLPLCSENLSQFKTDMQEAFQAGAECVFGKQEEILPEQDINESLQAEGAIAYQAVLQGKLVGGAIVVVDEKSRKNHLDFLYVKNGMQGQGIGQKIWEALEKRYPDTLLWETCTPYFDQRNIHFYINCCGFHAVEFYHTFHPDPNLPQSLKMNDQESLFRFEKRKSKSEK